MAGKAQAQAQATSGNGGKGKGKGKAAQGAPQPSNWAQHLPSGTVSVVGNGAGAQLAPAAALAAWAQAQPAAYGKACQALAAAGYTAPRAAQALAVLALRHQRHAWAACGQAVGLGTPGKARSGASGARSLANAGLGQAGQPGSAATAAMPAVARARTGQQQGAGKAQQQAS